MIKQFEKVQMFYLAYSKIVNFIELDTYVTFASDESKLPMDLNKFIATCIH